MDFLILVIQLRGCAPFDQQDCAHEKIKYACRVAASITRILVVGFTGYNKDRDKAGDTSPIRLRSTATSGQFKRQRNLAAIDTVVLPLATCRVRPPKARLLLKVRSTDVSGQFK